MHRSVMTEQEKYMKEAIRQARKAYALGEVPMDVLLFMKEKLLAEVTIAEIQIKIPLPMPRLLQSIKQVKRWETGGWRDVLSM